MRILMVGAGATGGFYGGLLLNAGRDVTFLLREQRAEQVRQHGLELSTHAGDHLTLHPKVVTAGQLRETPDLFDLVILSTKAYQLEGAMDDIAPAVGPQTMILPILNGMRHLALLQQRFGSQHVLAGSVRVSSDVDEVGRVRQLTALNEMSYGEPSGERTARILAVDETMRDAGFEAFLQPDILATLWQKWWILASVGSICTLGRGTIGQVAQVPHGPELARQILLETTSIAKANGYPPHEQAYASTIAYCTDPSSTLTSSMYRDMVKGAAVEADHILGDLLDRAGSLSVPLLAAAYVQLKVYESVRGA